MVRWLRWHRPPDTGFEIRALAVWGRARYLSVTEAPRNTGFHTWMGKKLFCFFQTAEPGNRTPNSGVKGSGANHYPRAPALEISNGHFKWMIYIQGSLNSCWGVDRVTDLQSQSLLFALVGSQTSRILSALIMLLKSPGNIIRKWTPQVRRDL